MLVLIVHPIGCGTQIIRTLLLLLHLLLHALIELILILLLHLLLVVESAKTGGAT